MSSVVIYDGFFLARVSYELLRRGKSFCEILRGFKRYQTSSFTQNEQKLRKNLISKISQNFPINKFSQVLLINKFSLTLHPCYSNLVEFHY